MLFGTAVGMVVIAAGCPEPPEGVRDSKLLSPAEVAALSGASLDAEDFALIVRFRG